MLEGIVNNSFQYQSVADVRRATKMEHVYGPQGWMSVTQATASKYKEKEKHCFDWICLASLQINFCLTKNSLSFGNSISFFPAIR